MVELLKSFGRRLGLSPAISEDRLASVLERPEVLLVHAEAKTTAGVYLANEPVIRLKPTAAPQELGAALRQALASFRIGVPHPKPEQVSGLFKPFLKAAGFRSWRSLEVGAKCCSVSQKPDGSIVIAILRNGGTRGDRKGFQPFGVPDHRLPEGVSDASLGAGVRKALELCE
jgi:hypothetical protein